MSSKRQLVDENFEEDYLDRFIEDGKIKSNIIPSLLELKSDEVYDIINSLEPERIEELFELDHKFNLDKSIKLKNIDELNQTYVEDNIFNLNEWQPLGPAQPFEFKHPINGQTMNYQIAIKCTKARLIFSKCDPNTFPRFAVLQSVDKVPIGSSHRVTRAPTTNICGKKRPFQDIRRKPKQQPQISFLLSESPELQCGNNDGDTFDKILKKSKTESGYVVSVAENDNTNISEISIENENDDIEDNENDDDIEDDENKDDDIEDNQQLLGDRFHSRVIRFERQSDIMSENFRWSMGPGITDISLTVSSPYELTKINNQRTVVKSKKEKRVLAIKMTKNMDNTNKVEYKFINDVEDKGSAKKQWTSFASDVNVGQSIFNGSVKNDKNIIECVEYLMGYIIVPGIFDAMVGTPMKHEVHLGLRSNALGKHYMIFTNMILDIHDIDTMNKYIEYMQHMDKYCKSNFESGIFFDTSLSAVHYGHCNDPCQIKQFPTLHTTQMTSPPDIILQNIKRRVLGDKYYFKKSLVDTLVGISKCYMLIQECNGGLISIELCSPPGLYKTTLVQSSYNKLGFTDKNGCAAVLRDATSAAEREHQDKWSGITITREDQHQAGLHTKFGDRDNQILGCWGAYATMIKNQTTTGKASQIMVSTSNSCTVNIDRKEVATRAVTIYFLEKDKPESNDKFNEIRKKLNEIDIFYTGAWYGIPLSKKDINDLKPTLKNVHINLAQYYEVEWFKHERLYQSTAAILAFLERVAFIFYNIPNVHKLFFHELKISMKQTQQLKNTLKNDNVSFTRFRENKRLETIKEFLYFVFFASVIVTGLNDELLYLQKQIDKMVVIHSRKCSDDTTQCIISFRCSHIDSILKYINLFCTHYKQFEKWGKSIENHAQWLKMFELLRLNNMCIVATKKTNKCVTYQRYITMPKNNENGNKKKKKKKK
eukprot:311845_1